ncbi:hypothetical protein GGI07_000385 [Coemansia sp. Benny D115]|nr:hypothetical protein GGI07_000385 [Coemansia sp. Benny D115]
MSCQSCYIEAYKRQGTHESIAASKKIATNLVYFSCGHLLHAGCMDKFFSEPGRNRMCPVCFRYVAITKGVKSSSSNGKGMDDYMGLEETTMNDYYRHRNFWYNREGTALLPADPSRLQRGSLEEEIMLLRLQKKEYQIREKAVAKNHRVLLNEIISGFEKSQRILEEQLEDSDDYANTIEKDLEDARNELDTKRKELAASQAKERSLAAEVDRLEDLSFKHREHITSLTRSIVEKKEIIRGYDPYYY